MKIYPSLLSSPQDVLEESILIFLQEGYSSFHLDIMDGAYVPHRAFCPNIIKTIRYIAQHHGFSPPHFHVHFMVRHPSPDFLRDFLYPEEMTFLFHGDAGPSIKPLLQWTKLHGKNCGLVLSHHCEGYRPHEIKTDIPLEYKEWPQDLWDLLDDVLIMGVLPGRGGQDFQHQTLSVGQNLRNFLKAQGKNNISFGVDGGFRLENWDSFSWAHYSIVGSFFFQSPFSSESLRKKISSLNLVHLEKSINIRPTA